MISLLYSKSRSMVNSSLHKDKPIYLPVLYMFPHLYPTDRFSVVVPTPINRHIGR